MLCGRLGNWAGHVGLTGVFGLWLCDRKHFGRVGWYV